MPPAIKIRDLVFTYPDGTCALNGISIDVHEGQKLAVIGSNGAGKTTLMLHLNGILKGKGHIEIQGLEINPETVREIRKRVGIVFQNPDDQLFMPTVFDDIAFGLKNIGLTDEEIKIRVRESLNEVGLPGFENRNSFHLSMGEKKRVATATVLSMRPSIIALDEPTGSLDPKGRREITKLIQKLEGTVIIVTHDLELSSRTCERVVVMWRGKITADGQTREILEDSNLLEQYDLA